MLWADDNRITNTYVSSNHFAQNSEQTPFYAPTPLPTVYYGVDSRMPLTRSESAPAAAQTTNTYQPREVEETFSWKLEIPYMHKGYKADANAIALLDTQTQKGNWISHDLLQRMHMLTQAHPVHNPPTLDTPSGSISAAGRIRIDFKRREGNRYYPCDFYVFPPSCGLGFDVILGRDFINRYKILSVNQDAMLPVLERDSLTPGQTDIKHAK